MCHLVGFIFNKVISLGYFKLPFDKMLRGNIKLAYGDIWQEKHQCKGIAVSSRNTKEESVMWAEGWVGQGE